MVPGSIMRWLYIIRWVEGTATMKEDFCPTAGGDYYHQCALDL